MKRIGFVDYKLDNFHADTYLSILRNDLKARGYDVSGCIGLKPKVDRAWALQNKIPYFDTAEELDRNVDFYVVLAPSNPEVHLQLCRLVFPFGKPAYVDKTFAPDFGTAKRIMALADRYGVKLQSTSALRYTNVQDCVAEMGGRAKVRHMVTWGDGRSFDEYAIHPVELLVSCMGPSAESLMCRRSGNQSQILINFSRGRTAVVNVYTKSATRFAAAVTTAAETRLINVDGSQIFLNTASAILDLFDTGRPVIDRRETLVIRRILDLAQTRGALNRFVRL